ncbi:MAG TPA: hypothetical protein DCL48_03090 [Alphaproteobacteria bacterium]|nr:hypothetical protein [Alphaproteobacteria bacterium]
MQQRFAAVEQAARIGYWRTEAHSGRQFWSPGMYALLCLEPGSVEARPEWLFDRIHPDDRDEVLQTIKRAMVMKEPFFYRNRGLTPGGAVCHFDTFGLVELGPDGEASALMGVVQDVSDKVAAEEALKASEETYRLLSHEASDIICQHGPSGAVVFISPAVTRVLGFEVDSYLGVTPWDRTHPEDLESAMAAVNHARRTGEQVTYAFRARHKAGHYVWMESTTRFIFEGPQRLVKGAISVSRDITQRKAVEDELTRQREHAEAASQTKTRFLANMSHELRTPLNAIIGFSDILNKELFGPLGSERYIDYANLINESGTLLLDLINDLLDMSKIEAGKFELHYEDIAVQELAAMCVRIVSRRAEEKGLVLELDVQPADFRFRADQRAVKQILLNLLTNAVKFTSKGGVKARIALEGANVQIVIEDSGIGIPAKMLPRLGQPFEQAQNEASRSQGGSGLGLALVKSLAQLHGGSLEIASLEGQGTTVTVTLPADKPQTSTDTASAA